MVGSAIWRALEARGIHNLIGKTSKELDLRNQQAVYDFIQTEAPSDYRCGGSRWGILANNDYPYNFLMENMQIQNNLIQAAHELDVQKFVFLEVLVYILSWPHSHLKRNIYLQIV